MKRLTLILLVLMIPVSFCYGADGAPSAFDRFLTGFDYDTRADMKIDSKQLVRLLTENKAVLVDIRFPEETRTWKMGFGLFIPLNELPKRYGELPKDKIIVTACPHKDRSAIAMTYLRTKGYNARYLTDGLTGLTEQLRGDVAKEFMEDLAVQSDINKK